MAGNTNISQKNNVCSDPDQLLHGISDMFINSELCINYANMKKKVGWGALSNSILNKFAPGHSIFRQQLEKMKNNQTGFIQELKHKENLEKKTMLRNQMKGIEAPK